MTENQLQTPADGKAFLLEMQAKLDAEAAARETAAAAPQTPAAEEPIVNSVEAEATPEEIVSNVEVQKTWKDLLEDELAVKEQEERKADMQELLNDELAKTLLEAKKQGKDIRSVLKALSETDPNDFTEKQLFEMALNGEKNEYGEPLSEYEITEKYEQFQTLPKSVQEKLMVSQKQELEQKFNDATKVLKAKSENPYMDAAKQANENLLVTVDKLVGRNVFGVEVTAKIAKELYVEAVSQLKTTINGNVFNVESAIEKAISVKMLPYLISDAQKKANTEAKIELFKQFNSPSSSGKPVVTTAQTPKSKDQISQDSLNAHAARYSDPFGINKNTN